MSSYYVTCRRWHSSFGSIVIHAQLLSLTALLASLIELGLCHDSHFWAWHRWLNTSTLKTLRHSWLKCVTAIDFDCLLIASWLTCLVNCLQLRVFVNWVIAVNCFNLFMSTPVFPLLIKRDYAYQILHGEKTSEIRKWRNCLNVRPGMLLSLHWMSSERVEVPISDVHRWANVREAFRYMNFKRAVPNAEELEEALVPFTNNSDWVLRF